MGVPKFFRWLSERYPLVNQRVLEKSQTDCFYLDMNGIIHNSFQKALEESHFGQEEVFQKIFSYTSHLFRITRPRKLIYLAIDGVAPRAKMNQQRSRRFRSVKDLDEKKNQTDELRNSLISISNDSNCITPGTKFMSDLSYSFKKWLEYKIKNDLEWQQGCDVIFSGPEVPGEGEHKIMNFIRKMKKWDIYSKKDLKHCLYGLDADLIMLGLVSREKHFTLLREKLVGNGKTVGKNLLNESNRKNGSASDEFHLLEVSLLRDMLFLEFKPRENFAYKYILERVVDDFAFMCMLIGNDFLPSLPHLDIASGGLNLLVRSYKEIQKNMKGYLTQNSKMHLGRVEIFLEKLSSEAEGIYFFKKNKYSKNSEKIMNYKFDYYVSKFGKNLVETTNVFELKVLKENYIEGLNWCLNYYHNGCPSWNWFFPGYFGPLGSDLSRLSDLSIKFTKGRPFEPITQLLAVLPPKSSNLLPESLAKLMIQDNSPISNFYPENFQIDMNGKKNVWEGIILLPFIEQKKLLEEVKINKINNDLSFEEKNRNCFARDIIFYSNF
mmetsp:Transcript_51534/g.75383  ORF Transcript_51534/g.75383 Transcript_51534/m.75383 type:complete len:550 (-) Transcript_51534:45-1694(-)